MKSPKRLSKVVIVGGGFGGLFAAKALRKAPVELVLIDKTNAHVFQPLLYQVATAGLSPADIAQPIRSILRNQANATVWMDEVVGVDAAARIVRTRTSDVHYDYLVLATGARHAYFGHDDWEAIAPGLKTLEDALRIRRRILDSFERAELCGDPVQAEKLLRFVVVGGGPTGVEMAGSIAELARRALSRDFRRIDPTKASIILVEAGGRILPSFSPRLSAKALGSLQRLGVQVQLHTRVENVGRDGIRTTAGLIESPCCVWAAGVQASAAGQWFETETDTVGRIKVESDCSIPGQDNVFVIGDTMRLADSSDRPLPGVSQVAMQQGRFVAEMILDEIRTGTRWRRDFEYIDKGSMATIGRRMAVAQIGRFGFSGLPAWLLWLFVHIWYLIGFDNKILVLVQWAWSYATFHRGARLITDEV